MTRRRQSERLVRGHGAHRRTEGDYMAVLLDGVTLNDWREVVNKAKAMAKAGDAQARGWLAQYLMGKPDTKAPAPLTVVVQQWNGDDPVAEKLAKPIISRARYPGLHGDDEWEEGIREAIAAELAQRLPQPEAGQTPPATMEAGDAAN